MKKKGMGGRARGALLVYLSVRGIQLQEVADGFRTIHYGYTIPVLAALFLMQVLRSFRWGLILNPLEKVDQLSLFSVTSVGFLAIVAIPARLGELARPYLITKKSQINMSAALGTIFVERIFDSFTVLSIVIIVLFFMPLPTWLISASLIFFLVTTMVAAIMVTSIVKRDGSVRLLTSLFNILPERYALKLTGLIDYFIDGFAVITDPKRFLQVMLL